MQQGDFILAESSLRQALNIREQWFGKSHPLVAEVLYSLAQLMGNPDNYRGWECLQRIKNKIKTRWKGMFVI